MKKSEAASLTVRILGICFCLYGIYYLFSIFESVMLASTASVGQTLITQGAGLFLSWIIKAILSFLAGLYLLRDGDFVFNLLVDEIPVMTSSVDEDVDIQSELKIF